MPSTPSHSRPVGYEARVWAKDSSTYQAAVPANVAGLETVGIVTPSALLDAADAEQRLATFDARLTSRLGDRELGTVEEMLMRTEAASSSQIENVTAGAAQISAAVIGESRKINAQLVARNVAAMRQATDLADRMDVETLLDVHHTLLPHLPRGPRTEQVWIGTSSLSPRGAVFIPPHHERVPEGLDDLMEFCRREEAPRLARAALAHAQFETIHPFVDGNGRVGRALVHAMLRRSGLAAHVTIPVSAGLLVDTVSYVQALTAYREGDPDPIVVRFADAAREGVESGERLLEAITQVRLQWTASVKARRGSTARRLMDLLVGQPVVTTNHVAASLEVSAEAARTAILHLVEAGVLTKLSVGSRNQVWVARQVTDAFDQAAQQGRRRVGF